MTTIDYDVVVAGAGPVGLFLGCELALGGASVLVIERLTEVDETIKAGAINIPSAVALYRRGLLPELAAVWEAARQRVFAFRQAGENRGGPEAKLPPKFAGHFAGIMMDPDLFDGSDPAWAEVGPAGDTGLGVPQAALERILARHAEGLGVQVRRGVELTGFDADADGVAVHTAEGTIRAGWLVGCDGGRSTVRKLAGFDFPGTDPEITGYQAVVELTGAERLRQGWNTTDTGTYVHGPFPGRILTVEFDGPPADRSAPITAQELQASLRRVTEVPEVAVTEVHSATRFTDNARQATEYRKGRVLIAGDAAHVHSPFGGQGLNLGLGDAMNLGWKLAAVVRGTAPESLLDSYTAERHPIGAWVLDWTRAQIAVMRPDRHARALRRVVTDLALTTTGTTYLVSKIAGIWQRYDLPGDHPLTGASAPDLVLADGSRLGDQLRSGRALLLDLADDPELRARAEGYGDRLQIRTLACPDRPDLRALFVRPDGFVAWAADTEGTDTKGLPEALERWLGTPTTGDA
ncbi:FAD-dependent oxidoreductase [Streptomyces yokosukanensis]|uniref:FAD-dependent oxidoreductase n=1 Tax=Streptomyces yokosukanensis TaxID=67386 RepID=A0A117Q269_9ACTN|nr:FAD-dependent monooxygenase [Streptomyces yokosukanensis]KUN05049.1 FAD-dependent oxidoreductase [Streptomyces yokosukanensis]